MYIKEGNKRYSHLRQEIAITQRSVEAAVRHGLWLQTAGEKGQLNWSWGYLIDQFKALVRAPG